MDIAVIGGGWVGCHLTYKLNQTHNVTLYDKNANLMHETSYNNQNRLHYGFHYARNLKTRQLCKETFDVFLNDYDFLTEVVSKNYYCVTNESIVDYGTYLEIFKNFDREYTKNFPIQNIEGCLNTKERYINFESAFNFFNQKLKTNHKHTEVSDLYEISHSYDLVINCTNGALLNNFSDNFFELTLTLKYQKIDEINFDAITLVDGEFFSLYPYKPKNNIFSLTDVEHTPLKVFNTIEELKNFEVGDELIQNKRKLMEEKVAKYYPKFHQQFKYDGYFLSTKTKNKNKSANRYPTILKENNVISCFTGKIQGIYPIENYVMSEISKI